MSGIKLQFDDHQEHQKRAIDSVTGLFDGLSRSNTDGFRLDDEIIPNLPPYISLDSNWLLDNLNAIQRQNGVAESLNVESESGPMVDGVSFDTWEYPVFTIEMETGTGKTYAYLRTIYQLNQDYGFRKFIIVVPSVAIYEGVVNAFSATREHFKGLYGNGNVTLLEYDSDKLVMLKNFATSTSVEILVMTVDSFNKKTNKVFKKTDKLMGDKLPYQFLQETRPILILDESQNYQSDKSRAALSTLKPLVAIQYSATPVKKPGLLYNLTPFAAFQKNLVKKIEVLGMMEAQSAVAHEDYLKLIAIDRGKTISARFKVMVNIKGSLQEQELSFGQNAKLWEKTHNSAYEGWKVKEINLKEFFVEFSNGERFILEDERYASLSREAIFRRQIEETIKTHFAKQRELRAHGVKVLSLFFIDRVASYCTDDGIIKQLFDKAFEKLKKSESDFKAFSARQVREGYFAKKKEKNNEIEIDTSIEAVDKNESDKTAEKWAYELIMKRKEVLLSFDEPVCFIFAHSALKEGWDNPNVFQICALREITSEKERRQTIGRGLRLPVSQDGNRVTDRHLNLLTVIANESYANYVSRLQSEYAATGDEMPQMPSDSKSKETATRDDKVFNSRDFQNFWNKLITRTEYVINFDSKIFVNDAIRRLNNSSFPEPHLVITKGTFIITHYCIDLIKVNGVEGKIRYQRETSTGDKEISEFSVQKGDDLQKMKSDPVLKGFKVTAVSTQPDDGFVEFNEAGRLTRDRSIIFSTEKGQVCSQRTESERVANIPIPNLIDRAAKELSLTRSVVLEIFKGLDTRIKRNFIKNPEGFSSVFIAALREAMADHIVQNLEYVATQEILNEEIEEMFPPQKVFPTVELIAGFENRSLYDYVQIDSTNEVEFVHRLNDALDDKTILYFKFPGTFKIRIPKIIGNYNPDWGILRWDEHKKIKLELVRETKGNIDLKMLQFSNEGRKVRCAGKHFQALGISYRHVTGQTTDWWEEET